MSNEHLRFAFVECFCVCSGISIFYYLFVDVVVALQKGAHTYYKVVDAIHFVRS